MLVVPSQQNEKIKALMEQVVPGYNDLPIEATTQISNVSAVIKKDYDPDVIPGDIGRTWVNTTTGDRRVSNGKTAISDWIAQTGTSPTPDIVGWSTNIVWSSTDSDTVAWTSGTISLADGSSFSVNSGNTGNISAINYVYYDGTTTLKTTTTPQTAVGSGKILLCVAKNSTSPTLAQFQAFGTLGQSVFITADNIAANTITANELAANSIDGMTITGALIRTASTGQRIVMDNTNNRIQFYDSLNNDSGFLRGFYSDALGMSIIESSSGFYAPYGLFGNIYTANHYPVVDGTQNLGDGSFRWNNLYLNGGLNFDNGDGILTEVSGTPRWNNGTNYGILISDSTTSTSSLTATGKISVNIAGTTFKLLYNNT